MKAWFAALLGSGATLCQAAPTVFTVSDTQGAAGRCAAPVAIQVDLTKLAEAPFKTDRLMLVVLDEPKPGQPEAVPAQFEPNAPGSSRGRLWWLMPPGRSGQRRFALEKRASSFDAAMQAQQEPASGRWDIRDAGKPVLSYHYLTQEPGDVLLKVQPDNRRYARPRSDYIHPLYGPDGEVLTKDWPVDHPHHRGIYWAWPEVDYRGERGDLHALQRIYARPAGRCDGQSGPVFARIEADNLWRWEDREPIVHERVIIRAWRAGVAGRGIDLELHLTALLDDVALARRETRLYGGLNLRLGQVKDQQILFHTDPSGAKPQRTWAELLGTFTGGRQPVGLAVFQKPTNPDYPGDWVQYPEINWFQPAFPAAGTRYVLKKNQPLVLQFRLWVQAGIADEQRLADIWAAYAESTN